MIRKKDEVGKLLKNENASKRLSKEDLETLKRNQRKLNEILNAENMQGFSNRAKYLAGKYNLIFKHAESYTPQEQQELDRIRKTLTKNLSSEEMIRQNALLLRIRNERISKTLQEIEKASKRDPKLRGKPIKAVVILGGLHEDVTRLLDRETMSKVRIVAQALLENNELLKKYNLPQEDLKKLKKEINEMLNLSRKSREEIKRYKK